MVRQETQVWNRTDAKIEVKEGNGGIFNLCMPLPCNAKHKVRIESDTTYRTFKVLRMGDTMNNAHDYVDLDSDYLTDNRIVYIRINEQGRCYKDGILRETKPVTKEIVNNTGETLVIKETADLGDHTGRLTSLKELRPGDSFRVDVIDPLNKARVLRYSVETASACSREITAEDFTRAIVEVSMAVTDHETSREKTLVVGQRREDVPTQRSFVRSVWPSNWFKYVHLFFTRY